MGKRDLREEGGPRYFLWGSFFCVYAEGSWEWDKDELRVFPGCFSVHSALWCMGLYRSENVRNGGGGKETCMGYGRRRKECEATMGP